MILTIGASKVSLFDNLLRIESCIPHSQYLLVWILKEKDKVQKISMQNFPYLTNFSYFSYEKDN